MQVGDKVTIRNTVEPKHFRGVIGTIVQIPGSGWDMIVQHPFTKDQTAVSEQYGYNRDEVDPCE